MEVCSLFWYISRFSVTIPRCYQNIYVNSFFPHKASFPLIEFYKILCNIHVLFIKTLNALRAYNFVMLLFPSLIIDHLNFYPILVPSSICKNHKVRHSFTGRTIHPTCGYYRYPANVPIFLFQCGFEGLVYYFRVDPIMMRPVGWK